jgi:hypothetical protein
MTFRGGGKVEKEFKHKFITDKVRDPLVSKARVNIALPRRSIFSVNIRVRRLSQPGLKLKRRFCLAGASVLVRVLCASAKLKAGRAVERVAGAVAGVPWISTRMKRPQMPRRRGLCAAIPRRSSVQHPKGRRAGRSAMQVERLTIISLGREKRVEPRREPCPTLLPLNPRN